MDAFAAQVAPGQAAFSAGANDQVIARFYKDSKHMPAQSADAGRPVFKAMDMVEIRQVGETDSLKEEVHELHKMRWPNQWQQYQANMEQIVSGTPLVELFPGFPEVIAQLRMINVHTIEGLIKVPDSTQTATQVPFLTEWKKRAVEWQARMQKADGVNELEKMLDAERAARKSLEDRLAALEAGPKSKKLNLAPAEEA